MQTYRKGRSSRRVNSGAIRVAPPFPSTRVSSLIRVIRARGSPTPREYFCLVLHGTTSTSIPLAQNSANKVGYEDGDNQRLNDR